MVIKKDYTIVTTDADRAAMIEHINSHEYLAFDTETTGLNVRKQKVIGFSICGEAGKAFYYPISLYDVEEKCLITFNTKLRQGIEILEMLKQKELLMWNGSFDIRMINNNFGIDLTDSLIADGQLMAHTLMEEGPFALKTIGVMKQDFIGYDVEATADKEAVELKENVAKNGGSTTKANYEMYKADLKVLGKYACADADITFRLCEHFYSELEKENLLEFFFDEEVMPLYKEVTIPMEDRGVKLDLELIKSTKELVEADLLKLESSIVKSIFLLPETNEWYSKCIDDHCKVSNKGKFAQGLVDFYKLELPKTKKGKYSTTKKLIDKLEDSEPKAFLLGNEFIISEDDIKAIKKGIYEKDNPKKLNISSKKQMGEIVFAFMGIKELSKTDKGSKRFDDEMITSLAEDHDWAALLGDYNKLIKIRGTYLDRFLDNEEDGKYYFSYKQHGTISGRYGSDAQQLPRPKEEGQLSELVLKYTNVIRKFFISGEGRKFVDCDYESLEPHVFAHVSEDDGLKDIFRNGHDFYSTIAISTEGLSGVSADKKAENYLGKVDKQKRQDAKAYALGVPYGMRGYALGKTLDIPTDVAEGLVESYLGAYPSLKKWIDDTKAKVRKDGYITTQVGRVRHLPKVKSIYKVHKDKLLDYRYRNKVGARIGHDVVKELYRDYKNGENNSINFQIQSLSASIVNRAAIAINRHFKSIGVDAWVCAQIHDQLIINIPEVQEKAHAIKIQDLMENTTKISLDLRAPACLATNWYEGH